MKLHRRKNITVEIDHARNRILLRSATCFSDFTMPFMLGEVSGTLARILSVPGAAAPRCGACACSGGSK
jgi:hypothetical protein